MERLESLNPERIVWCIGDRGISIDALAAETRIPYASIDRALNRELSLTFKQIQKIANYFGRGVLFFLEAGPVDEQTVHTAQFRTLSNQKPSLSPKLKIIIERAEKQRSVYLALLEELGLQDSQDFVPPDILSQTPKEAANTARHWLRIADTNTFEGYRAAIESRGILVFRSNGYNGKWQIPKESPILGFSLFDQTCPLIVVRKQKAEARQSFTLAHELGHLLLHRSSSIDDDYDLNATVGNERDANIFAANFLVPESYLNSINVDGRPEDIEEFDIWLREYRRAWGVSTDVILLQLVNTGRVNRNLYTAYRNWKSHQSESNMEGGTRSYRYREPKHLFGDKFVHVVLDALNSRKITITRASRYLDSLKLKDLHQLESYYAGH
ncbi:MAG: peptidase [marine bacterium B5-7]|nr:MAG: peptidase [marine bacterium B5-7]